jgi:hypothetical protein
MSSDSSKRLPDWGAAEHVPVAELARRQGVRPIESVAELARPDLFESDEELDEFISFLHTSRHTGLAWASASSALTYPHPSCADA